MKKSDFINKYKLEPILTQNNDFLLITEQANNRKFDIFYTPFQIKNFTNTNFVAATYIIIKLDKFIPHINDKLQNLLESIHQKMMIFVEKEKQFSIEYNLIDDKYECSFLLLNNAENHNLQESFNLSLKQEEYLLEQINFLFNELTR